MEKRFFYGITPISLRASRTDSKNIMSKMKGDSIITIIFQMILIAANTKKRRSPAI